MSNFQPPATRLQPQQESSPSLTHLLQAQFVHIKSAAASSLTLLYAGLYRVMERREKYFYIEVGEQKEAVSTDQFKPHFGTPLFREPSRLGKAGGWLPTFLPQRECEAEDALWK
jgi:hypothetical protein